MKKKLLFVSAVAILTTLQVKAQTKLGNNPASINSNALLELETSNKGLLLPRVGLSSTTSFAPLTAHVAGMTVYNTATTGTGATAVTPGYYYNDGAKWLRIGIANAVANNPTNTRVELSTTSTGGTRAAGTEVTFQDDGKVGIGTASPTANLDVNGTVRVRNLGTGASGDQVVTTDANGNLRKISLANLVDGSQTKFSSTGSNVIIDGAGTTANPYTLNSVAETATNTPSTAVTASTTSVAVSSTNVQGAITDLATAIVTNKVKLAAGTNTTVTGTGSVADPYKVNTAFQNAASTPSIAVTASATQVAVNATNVQAAIESLATSIDGRDGTDDAWVNNTTTGVVELKTLSNGTTSRTGGTQVMVRDNGSMVVGSSKLTYPSRLTLVSDNISTAASNYLNDNLELMAFGNSANKTPYPIVDISSSFGTEATPANFPNCTGSPIGVGAVRWNARAANNKIEVARIGVSYVGNGSTNLGEMTFTTNGNNNQLVLSSNGGVGVGVKTTTSSFAVSGLDHYSSNTAAKSAGLKVGDFYQSSGDVKVVY
jgi:hypothetical protein